MNQSTRIIESALNTSAKTVRELGYMGLTVLDVDVKFPNQPTIQVQYSPIIDTLRSNGQAVIYKYLSQTRGGSLVGQFQLNGCRIVWVEVNTTISNSTKLH